MTIGIFYGSDTGATEEVAEMIAELIGEEKVELNEIGAASPADFDKYTLILIGLSTWYDGELQSDWEGFFPNMDDIDFTGKTVAIFGLGDQLTYGEYFINGVGIIHDKVLEKGGKVVGEWPSDDYDFDESFAERDGKFVGLALDADNEDDKTDERVEKWLGQISEVFGFELS